MNYLMIRRGDWIPVVASLVGWLVLQGLFTLRDRQIRHEASKRLETERRITPHFSAVVTGEAGSGIRFKWRKYLPRYPAVLLIAVVLGLWISLCTVGRKDTCGLPVLVLDPDSGIVRKEVYGFPFVFVGSKILPGRGPRARRHYGFMGAPFLADLAIALTAAYLLAMGVERLVFPALQARG